MSKKVTIEEFIKKASKIHNNKYDYSKVVYIKQKIKIKIICPFHGVFYQRIDHHLNGHGCDSCAHESLAKNKKIKIVDFLKRSHEIHGLNRKDIRK